MERLTNKREADAQREEYERRLANGYARNIPEERFLRLAAYEDTGLTPERCAEFARADAEGRYIVMRDAEQEGVARLRELAEADRAGRLVVLPCKVGAPVYTTHWWKDVKEKCTDSKGNSFYRTVHKNIIKKERFNPFGPDYEWLGKTVFLTREEAEKALEAMKNV